MATQILNPPDPDSIFPTCSLPPLEALTDLPKVCLTVVDDEAPGGASMLYTYLYPSRGAVAIGDARSLFESVFEDHGWAHRRFLVTFGTEVMRLGVLYCRTLPAGGIDPANDFLTSSGCSLVYPGSVVSLPFCGDTGGVQVRAVTVGGDGVPRAVDVPVSVAPGSEAVTFEVDGLLGAVDARVHHFTVTRGAAQHLCYVSPPAPYYSFLFLNNFNASEYACIPATLTRRPKYARQSALCGGVRVQYGHTSEVAWEFSVQGGTLELAAIVEQLVASHRVEVLTAAGYVPVVLDTHTLDTTADDETVPLLKFTVMASRSMEDIVPLECGSPMAAAALKAFGPEFTLHFR